MSKETGRFEAPCSRRSFLAAVLAAPVLAVPGVSPLPSRRTTEPRSRLPLVDGVTLTSPDGHVQVRVFPDDRGRLRHAATFRGVPFLETSPLGIVVDGVGLGDGVAFGEVEAYQADERYPWRGGHAEAVNRFRGARIALTHIDGDTPFTVDVRVFDDGIAFRHVVPGSGSRVPEEATGFMLPAGSIVWYHGFGGHYEDSHDRMVISDVPAGDWAAPPLTYRLPDGAGYASITEGGLVNYAGMGLQADGRGGFAARLGHAHPPSYPFTLRYGEEEAERLSRPAAVTGALATPWRVVMVGADLNTLVNADIVHNVSPPPDPRLFPDGLDTAWIRPGRCVWRYLDGGENTLEEMKTFSRLAGELGFEYHLIEGFWQRWTEDELRELVDYSREQGVGIWLWKHSRDLRTPEERRAFFQRCRDAGAVGAKVDFFDHEAKEVIDLYEVILREAAEHEIMLNFHGANKPAGEARTWPNELTREAVSGMERRSMEAWSAHNTTLPFTRMLAGHADFTPMLFGERRRETSWAHQIASAAILTSPLLVYGAHPRSILDNPAVELIKSIPSVWDETIALPESAIGELAAFARRHGDTWFLAVMNGPTARTLDVPLTFLSEGGVEALVARDQRDDPAAVVVEHITVNPGGTLAIELRAGGGAVVRFGPSPFE